MELGLREKEILAEIKNFFIEIEKMMQKAQENTVYTLWRECRNDMADMFSDVKQTDRIITENRLFEREIVNIKYIRQLCSELDSSCFADRDRFLKNAIALREYTDLLYMLFEHLMSHKNMFQKEILNVLEYCYIEQNSEELREIARNIIRRQKIDVFTFQRKPDEIVCDFDEEAGMYYAIEEDMRIYFPIEIFATKQIVVDYMNSLHTEQDDRSPHRYLTPRMEVPEGAVVMDAGVAEGNFSAGIVKKVKKLYLIECEPCFVRALQWTFKDYMDKVVIVDKFLAGYTDEHNITIDDIMQGEPLDYLKMDIEGAEVAALHGGERTLSSSPNLKCNICVYHRLRDNEAITEILSHHGMDVQNTPGYMLFHLDKEYPCYPRKGLAQAVKSPSPEVSEKKETAQNNDWIRRKIQQKGQKHIIFCKWQTYGQEAVIEGLRQQGHEVTILPYALNHTIDDKETFEEVKAHLRQFIKEHPCDVVFTLNYFELLSDVCQECRVIYVSWCVDAPLTTLYTSSIYHDCNYIFQFDRAEVTYLRKKNVKNIFHLPLFGDIPAFDTVLDAQKDWQWKADLSHVGSTYKEKSFYGQSKSLMPPYLQGYIEGAVKTHVYIPGSNALEECITDEIETELKKNIDLKLGKNFIGDWKKMFSVFFLSYMVTSRERAEIFHRLSQKYRLHLYSKGDLSEFAYAEKCGTADYYQEMPLVFRSSKINLNITSRCIKTGIPLRVFDVLACRGFLMTNYQQEIAEMFRDGQDLVMYHNMADLEEKTAYYLTHEKERLQIAKNGYETIRKHHTVKCRLDSLWDILQKNS